jgi:Tfp pilus assembly protein PilW
MRALRTRLSAGADREAGLTLVELLVAAAMSVILVGAACAMLISAVREQPKLSKKDQNITTARYVLERMTREIRNGTAVQTATGSEVSFTTQVRRTACGGPVQENQSLPSIECQVTYRCTTTECTRTETEPEVSTGGTPTTVVSGLDSSNVFNYEPSEEEPTFIGITLHIANPEGAGELTVTDGAGLRILDYAVG